MRDAASVAFGTIDGRVMIDFLKRARGNLSYSLMRHRQRRAKAQKANWAKPALLSQLNRSFVSWAAALAFNGLIFDSRIGDAVSGA